MLQTLPNNMEARATLDEDKKVFSHGVWVAGLKITDALIRSIAEEFHKKPSRACTLSLTSVACEIRLLPTSPTLNPVNKTRAESKPGRSQIIPFPALREVYVNPHNQYCLLVVYVDVKRLFSVLVCSCENPRSLCDVTRVFKELKKRAVLQSAPGSPKAGFTGNWTLRSPTSSGIVGTRLVTGSPRLNGDSHTAHNEAMFNGQDDLLENGTPDLERLGEDVSDDDLCLVERELAAPATESRPQTYHASVQALVSPSDPDADSLVSCGSTRRGQAAGDGLSEDVPVPGADDVSISGEEIHRRGNKTGPAKDEAYQTRSSSDPGEVTVLEVTNRPTLRSVSAQTDLAPGTPLRKRYTKKQVNTTLSNQYKEKMAAARKRGGSGSGSPGHGSTATSPTSPTPLAASAKVVAARVVLRHSGSLSAPPSPRLASDGAMFSKPAHAPSRHNSLPIKLRALPSQPSISTSGSTISRSIEDVYASKQRLHVLPHSSDNKNHNNNNQQQQRFVLVPQSNSPNGFPARGFRHSFSGRPGSAEARLRRVSGSSFTLPGSRAGSRTNSLRVKGDTSSAHMARVVSLPSTPTRVHDLA